MEERGELSKKKMLREKESPPERKTGRRKQWQPSTIIIL